MKNKIDSVGIKEVIVITGSSNKFSKEISELAELMRGSGHTIIIDSMFHSLEEDRGRKLFMVNILQADVLIVYNEDGYIGFHTCLEIVLAKTAGIKILYFFPQYYPEFIDRIEEMYYLYMEGL